MEWTIKQTATITGLSADTLRYYEKEGMVSPKRHENGYRSYDEQDIAILKNIVVMKYAHFTLAEMKSMEALYVQTPRAACNEISKRILNEKIVELNQAVRNYQKVVALIKDLLLLADCHDSYIANAEQINGFIGQIFDDVKCGALRSSLDAVPTTKGNEA